MSEAAKRIERLRALMAERGIDAYIVPTADYHQSEYVGEYFKARRYITGFTGSAGTAVIGREKAGLWTDGRYFTQAEKQLEGSGVELMKLMMPGTPSITEWISDNVPSGGRIGFDGRAVSMGDGENYEKTLAGAGITIDPDMDLTGEIWDDRPALSDKPCFRLDERWTGESQESKLARVRAEMEKNGATVHILTSLDDICWLLNIRGDDIAYFPLVLSYMIVRPETADVYIDESKLGEDILDEFASNSVNVHPYNDIYKDAAAIDSYETALIDPNKVNYSLYRSLKCGLVMAQNPEILMKSMKNETELANIRNAHIKDGVAVTKFMYWLKNNYDKEEITELSASRKLTELRASQDGYIRDSFEPLHAYGEHAAMMHYSPTPESDVRIEGGRLHLSDTGGGYYDGSTDITRTFVLGSVDDEVRKLYTTVYRSMMHLASAKFLYGADGKALDVLAREPMWELGLDYKCGTGHGVGYLGSIHEGPAGFRWYIAPWLTESHQLEEGMVLTIEPGIYEEGWMGIRIENEFIVRKAECNKYGQFMDFEIITFAPIDLDAIDPALLTEKERSWLNEYHSEVYDKIAPHLTDEEREWLREYTRAV